MELEAVRTMIWRHRGIAVALAVIGLAAVAALLALNVVGQARQLAAGAPPASNEASPTIEPTASPEPSATPEPTTAPTPDATAAPTPEPTPEPAPGWALAAAFGDADQPTGVMDVTAWNGTFVAVGTSWTDDRANGRMWRSTDGRTWSESVIDLGPGVSLQLVTTLPDNSLMLLGTIDDDVTQWTDPLRAGAWTSADGIGWTPLAVPFGAKLQYGPVEFAAGAEGLVATTGDEIWHSVDGRSWSLVHDAPRGTWLYGPVAGDEGWIVKRGNASLSTTTLLVSGDATTWHEVDLGNVATVVNVAGDWLVSRATEDWQSTEILRSANGLDWTVILNLDELTPPEGTQLTANGAALSGTGDVLVMSPWQGGHCGGMPANGWGAWWSTDGFTWASADLGDDAVVTHAVEAGEVTILAGYHARTSTVAFWVSTP